MIEQDGVVTGWDDGGMGFDENAVWFSGRATSFRIGAPDILPGTYALSGVEAVTDGEAKLQGFPLRHSDREVWVRVEILELTARQQDDDEKRLIGAVKRLRAQTTGKTVSQYPPLIPRPRIIPKPTPMWWRVAAGLGALLVLRLSILFDPTVQGWLRSVFFLDLVSIGSFQPTASLRKLRRIAELEGAGLAAVLKTSTLP